MNVADQFQKIRVFFTDNRFITILKKVSTSPVTYIECYRVSGHKTAHDLAERGRAGAQKEVKMLCEVIDYVKFISLL